MSLMVPADEVWNRGARLVGAIVKQSHDGHGLVWPREVAPADVHAA